MRLYHRTRRSLKRKRACFGGRSENRFRHRRKNGWLVYGGHGKRLEIVGARNYRKGDFNKLTASDDGSTPFGETYDAQGFWFTGVLVSLENSYTNADDGKTYAHRYNVPFAARAYVKIGSSYYYGSCRTASLVETAQRIKETGGDAYTKNQAYIDNILAQADAILDE